ncbi:gelsolin-related protein of 125 kDa-like [Episyrphus balteatus]|uniref:gelsolin-related protein of 125 kDa-like n=1 Tax=Episyrphus balteatus TaxID=286459 RepID=UPI00248674BC|nr:gelsolin-related protein of 125 kDa-like [Episyrphus balteatus]
MFNSGNYFPPPSNFTKNHPTNTLKSVLPTQPVDKMEETTTQVRRTRTAFTNVQLMELEKEFEKCIYLHRSRRIDISQRLSLNETHVKVWFQNRRMKIKRAPIIANGNKVTKSFREDHKIMRRLMSSKSMTKSTNTSLLTEDIPKENVIPKKPIAPPRPAKMPISSMPSPTVQYQQFPPIPSTVNHTKPLIELYQIIPTPASAFHQYQVPPPQLFEDPQLQFYENSLNLPATQVFFQPNHQYQSQQYWNQYQFHQTNQEQLQQYQQQFQQYYQSPPVQNQQVQFQQLASSRTLLENSEVSTNFDTNIYKDVHKPDELISAETLDLSEFLKFNKPQEKMETIQIKEEPKDELFDILEEIYKSGLQDERQQLSTVSLSESINSFEAISNNFSISENKSDNKSENNLKIEYEDISFDEEISDPQTSINNLSFDQVHQNISDFV